MNEEEKDLLDRLKYIYENDRKVNRYGSLNYSIPIDPIFCKKIIELIEKQQKEIKARLKEIDSLYKMMSAKDERIEGLTELVNKYNDMQYIRKVEEKYISKDKIKELREIDNIDLIQFKLKELLGE